MSVSPLRRRRGAKAVVRESMDWRELRRTPYGLRPAAIFSARALVGAIGARLFLVAGPDIARDVDLDLRTIAGIFSVLGTLTIVGTLFVGWLADRTNRIRLAGAGEVISGVSSMVQSRAVGTASFAVPAVAGNAGNALSGVPFFSLASDYYPLDARGRVFAMILSAARVGRVLSLLVVGLLVTFAGWRTTVLLLGCITVLFGLLVLTMREPVRGYFEKREHGLDDEAARHEDPPSSFGEGWRAIWSVRMVRRLFVSNLFFEIGSTPYEVFLPFFLAEVYGLNAAQRSLFAIPTVLAGLFGGVLGGGLIDVLGRRSPSSLLRVLGLIAGIPTIGFVILGLQPHIAIAALSGVLILFGTTVVQPAFVSIYSQVIPANIRSQGIQIVNLADIPGQILLGLLFGTVVTVYGFGTMFLAVAPFIAVSFLVLITAADLFEVDRRNALVATAANEEARRAAEAGRAPFLLCRGVNVSYDGVQVLFGVDLEVSEGEILALLGTNGAGKSTLLRAISGTQEASDGAIVFGGRDITHMPPHEIARRGVVHMPGGRGTFPGLTVEDNLRLATWLEPDRTLDEAYELFPLLAQRRQQEARLLSGGEQQMLSLAQAFLSRPKLLMIDELSLGLSPAVVGELVELVREINRRGTTVIVVEQSVNVALTIAQRAVFMEKGEVRFAGPTAELLRRPDVLRAVYVKGTGPGRAPARAREAGERTVLEVQGVTKRYGGITALDAVDLTLRDRQITGVVGPNGSGKTTLFDVVSGYQRADAGRIVFDGRDVSGLDAHERARLGLVRRFQDARLFPSLTVTESLLVALDQRLDTRGLAAASAGIPALRRSERKARARADRLIELLELGDDRDRFVKELSTGLRRIVDIAWILATDPKVLLLDEPSSGVAQSEAEALAPLLRRVRTETGCAILLVEHDIPLVSSLADELVAMASGSVIARGRPDEVLADARVVEAFLGTSEAAVRRTGAPA